MPRTPENTGPFASIPAGTVQLRDARSSSTRAVALVPFEIGTTPVTAGQWSNPGTMANPQGSLPAHPVTWFEAIHWCNGASIVAGLKPVYDINDREVVWDVGADGYRLPTEAEWEWACRAGTAGPTYGPLENIAWTAADNVEKPQGVALKQPNGFDLFDTIGNVWEWCWDYADTARYGDYRSLRGGGWADKRWSCRAAVRRGSAPDALLEDVGFRVARGAVGEPGGTVAQGWSAEADRRRADIRGPLPVGWTPLRGLLKSSGSLEGR
ncbi:formylglycine-generating enzyme family protein [Paeniglutamicibacter kerguelensis]|uniref:Formylglycine-generating enzyme required for sulfatase activity n=1 Tax=Paeniglutamicibacter kerguelensis TaxID=254788 RepID=A0ABS4XI40_9MICC|nr:formylglycine-generating enzyme family protein [Paeniglutamicibacter kerguelensis]MBP2388139.1 formylglycine-generating enzyme required for sulfatase activity [Paeniglutamicibacter kerguelensis]